MMPILTAPRGNTFLIVLAWWSLADCSRILHSGRVFYSAHIHIFMITIWMESFKHMISSRWILLNLDFISYLFIMLMTWDTHQSSLKLLIQDILAIGSIFSMNKHRITPWLCLIHHFIFLFQPWSQHVVKKLSMSKSYKHNSMRTLVHRDCH
jgi:hypothetical protein